MGVDDEPRSRPGHGAVAEGGCEDEGQASGRLILRTI